MYFAGVGAHHQNGIVEKLLRDLQNLARSSLIHAITRWPDAITTHLWPYALRKANNVINISIREGQTITPMEMFSGVAIAPNLLHHHPFGCPFYVLERKMQGGFKAPKWASRARLGVYLGSSDYYANNVGLVLSITTGLVSPQFHLKYDDEYISVSPDYGNIIPCSEWQFKCGFIGNTGKGNKATRINLNDLSVIDNPPDSNDLLLTNEESIDNQKEPSVQPPEGDLNPVSEGEIVPPIVDIQPPTDHQAVTTRSGRVVGLPSHLQDYTVPMRRKRRILDGSIYKWKARLNVDGGKQIHGLDYWETYAPATSWSTIRLVLLISVVNSWELRQLDFVQAFPQAPIQTEMYMELPKGYSVDNSRDHHVLKLVKNIYGQKQAGRVWNEFLLKGLKDIGFQQSAYDM
jgi:Reverse transcriptase (RNA-dependent DNA polymerase)